MRILSFCLAVMVAAAGWMFCGISAAQGQSAEQTQVVTQAQMPTLPSADHFFGSTRFSSIHMSPSGKYLAAIMPVNGIENLAILELGSRNIVVISHEDHHDVVWYDWVNDDRLVYRTSAAKVFAPNYAVNRDGSDSVRLAAGTGDAYAGRVDQVASNNIILLHQLANFTTLPEILNTRTGQRAKLNGLPPIPVHEWLFDHDGSARVAFNTVRRRLFWQVQGHQGTQHSAWQNLPLMDDDGAQLDAKLLALDGTRLYVATETPDSTRRSGSAMVRILYYDLSVAKPFPKVLKELADPDGDTTLSSIRPVWDAKLGHVVGMRYTQRQPEGQLALEYFWLEPGVDGEVAPADWKDWQATIDSALPTRHNIFSRESTDGKLLVFSSSATDMGRYYFFDPETRRLEESFALRPDLEPGSMAAPRMMKLPASAGSGVLTLPRNGEIFPLVVILIDPRHTLTGLLPQQDFPLGHQTDIGTGAFLWDSQAQFLAIRGYAVLQMAASKNQQGKVARADIHRALDVLSANLTEEGKPDVSRICVIDARASVTDAEFGRFVSELTQPGSSKPGSSYPLRCVVRLRQKATDSSSPAIVNTVGSYLPLLEVDAGVPYDINLTTDLYPAKQREKLIQAEEHIEHFLAESLK